LTTIPRPLSPGEELLALHLRGFGILFEREFLFHPTRKWRFDFFLREVNVGIEVDGGNNGRHQRRAGFEGDCYKLNAAALLGIRVLRYTTAMVKAGTALDDVLEILKGGL
jgi:hypothetical protein